MAFLTPNDVPGNKIGFIPAGGWAVDTARPVASWELLFPSVEMRSLLVFSFLLCHQSVMHLKFYMMVGGNDDSNVDITLTISFGFLKYLKRSPKTDSPGLTVCYLLTI